MGDTLQGTPAIQAIKKKLPDTIWDTPIPNNDRKNSNSIKRNTYGYYFIYGSEKGGKFLFRKTCYQK